MDPRPFTILSLCSGVGGLDLGLRVAQPNARTICFVEIEAFACAILAARMAENALDPAPIWTNLRTFDGKPWRGIVDCITAGYPCQPFSVAGKQKGSEDPRHLWPDVFRVVREINPPFCFFENVGGHLRLGFEQVHDDLRSVGYRVKAGLFTAQEVGAPHKRERLFILAYRESNGIDRRMSFPATFQGENGCGATAQSSGSGEAFMADGACIVSERPIPERDSGGQSQKQIGGFGNQLGDPQYNGSLAVAITRGNEANDEPWGSASGCEKAKQSKGTDKLGNAEHDGSYAATLGGSDGENAGARGTAGGQIPPQQFARTDCLANTASAENIIRESRKLEGAKAGGTSFNPAVGDGGGHVADCDNTGFEKQCRAESVRAQHEAFECGSDLTLFPMPFPPGPEGSWDGIPESLEPAICRMADGLAHRVDRIRACGNGVVPLAAAYAWCTLMAHARTTTDGEYSE